MIAYDEFLANKSVCFKSSGINVDTSSLNPHLFPIQRDLVRWSLAKGRAAIWAACGFGKTAMQLEWASKIPGNVLVLAPLAVAHQTVDEGEKFGIKVVYSRGEYDPNDKIIITNYEMLDKFDPADFTGVVCDESSILKGMDSKTRAQLVETFSNTPFRLCCTATPAPNDYVEIGNHADFLGIMSRKEMLSMFFVHDVGSTQDWRLKGHAVKDFWKWVCSWAVMIRKPSDIGYPDDGFDLPPLNIHEVIVESSNEGVMETGSLFKVQASSLEERRSARKSTIDLRVKAAADLVASEPDSQWILWCNLNAESEALTRAIPGAVEITGSDSQEYKRETMLAFSAGKVRVLVTKSLIAGFGMNWQCCHKVIFVGLNDSWEQYYQAVRRCWRFGQTEPVDCYLVTSDVEGAVLANIKRKEDDANRMLDEMVSNMAELTRENVKETERETESYEANAFMDLPSWLEASAKTPNVVNSSVSKNHAIYHADNCDAITGLADNSIHYSIYSPPFASLYTFSNSERDMSNAKTHDEFYRHLAFLAPQLFRVTKPGRLMSFHCMDLPTSKARDGIIGITDFRGNLVKIMQDAGWILHSQVTIWKDPVTAMQRTKALGLLHKQLKKDSCMSRQGIPDYVVTMRKPGDNPEPVTHTNESFPVQVWQRYASPIWMDINPSDTLQKESAREHNDERHISLLQLEVIKRCIELWTNPGDIVLDPFAGIGSTGHVAVQYGRKFVGFELKSSYFNQAVLNLRAVEPEIAGSQGKLFEAFPVIETKELEDDIPF